MAQSGMIDSFLEDCLEKHRDLMAIVTVNHNGDQLTDARVVKHKGNLTEAQAMAVS